MCIFEQGGLTEGGHVTHNGVSRYTLSQVLAQTLTRLYRLDQEECSSTSSVYDEKKIGKATSEKKEEEEVEGEKRILMFTARQKPNISLHAYLEHLVYHTGISGEALMLAMAHLSRFSKKNRHFPINPLTIHRLCLTACLCACKFYDDQFSNNKHFAKAGGISLQEMNMLEIEYLFLSKFHMFVTDEQYQDLYRELLIDNPFSPKHTPNSPPPTKPPTFFDTTPPILAVQ